MPERKFSRLLVIRNDRLGDVMLILPLLEALATVLPETQIEVLIQNSLTAVFDNHPIVRHVLGDSGERIGKLADIIRAGSYDAVVVVNPTWRNALAARRSGVKWRVGQGNRLQGILFNHRVRFHRSQMEMHEAEYHLLYLTGLGITPPAELPRPRLTVNRQSTGRIEQLLTEQGIDLSKPIVGLHPGSGGSSRPWPAANYRALGEKLLATGYQVVISGGAGEKELAESMAMPGMVDLTGQTDLSELIALLARLAVFVSIDTGPMHVAAALGVPTVSIFSPQRGNAPRRWHPLGNRYTILQPEGISCGKCGSCACPDPECMSRVSVDAVLDAVLKTMAQK